MATLTVYPDPNPESTSFDGRGQYFNTSGETFGTMRGQTTSNNAGDADTGDALTGLIWSHATTNDRWIRWTRGQMLFDTSALTAGATISAATLSLYGSAVGDAFNQSAHIVSHTPSSNTGTTNSDFNITNFGSTSFSSIDLTSWNTTGYNDFAFNASGLAAISKTSVSKFGGLLSGDLNNSAPAWQGNKPDRGDCYTADDAGTTRDPKLVITYTTASAAKNLTLLGVG